MAVSSVQKAMAALSHGRTQDLTTMWDLWPAYVALPKPPRLS